LLKAPIRATVNEDDPPIPDAGGSSEKIVISNPSLIFKKLIVHCLEVRVKSLNTIKIIVYWKTIVSI